VLYIGFTENLSNRIIQHINNKGSDKSFAGKYLCTDIVYYEIYQYVKEAITREKQIKKWNRKKKDELIKRMNPTLTSFNSRFYISE